MSGRSPVSLLDQIEAALDHREVAQPEEVHLQQTEVLDAVHLVLGDDRRVLGVPARVRLALDGQVVRQRVAGDDHGGRMDPVLAAQALEAERDVDDLLGVGVGLVHGPQLGGGRVAVLVPLGPGEAGPQRRVPPHDQGRHGLGDAVAHHVRLAQHPGGVAHGRPRLDGRERDDLGHPVVPVPLRRVAHDVGPVALVEVHVDVGHLLAAGVQEALEEQVVPDGVEVHDAQAVGDAAPGGGPTAGADPDARLAGEADQVPHDQEVGRESHVPDDAQLVVEPLHHLGRQRRAVALPRPFRGQVTQVGQCPLFVGVAREAVRHREFGQARLAELDLDVGPLRDEQRVVARLGDLAEEMAHLGGALEVVLGALELEAVGVGEQRTGLHAQQGIVRDGVLAVRVVAVVGGEQRGIDAAGDLDELRVGALLVHDAVVLQFDVEVLPAEDVLQPSGPPLGLRHVAGQQGLEDHPSQASGRRDQAVVVALEELPVDPGLVVVALEIGGRGQLHEVAVALDGLRQQGQVVVELLAALGVATGVVHPAPAHGALVARLARHVGLGADDGHDALVAARLVEVEDPVHVPVVRDPQRRLTVGRRRRHELPDPGGAVEHGELGVGVQMRKRPLRHRPSFRHVKLTRV